GVATGAGRRHWPVRRHGGGRVQTGRLRPGLAAARPGGGSARCGWWPAWVHPGDRIRSVLLTHFAPLAKVPGLVSLQKGDGAEQLTEVCAAGMAVLDFGSRTGAAFADGAALLLNLDLVISVDTAATVLACVAAGTRTTKPLGNAISRKPSRTRSR